MFLHAISFRAHGVKSALGRLVDAHFAEYLPGGELTVCMVNKGTAQGGVLCFHKDALVLVTQNPQAISATEHLLKRAIAGPSKEAGTCRFAFERSGRSLSGDENHKDRHLPALWVIHAAATDSVKRLTLQNLQLTGVDGIVAWTDSSRSLLVVADDDQIFIAGTGQEVVLKFARKLCDLDPYSPAKIAKPPQNVRARNTDKLRYVDELLR